VNPLVGREERLGFGGDPLPKSATPKRVLVIGGGPAGMQAAITASACGHTVRLIERNERVGGWLRFTDVNDHNKRELRLFNLWLTKELEASGAEVCLNTEFSVADVEEFAPDAIIAALGSVPAMPNIDGIEKAHHATVAYFAPEKIAGTRIAVIGGGLVGTEIAIYLQNQGKQVTIFEMNEQICADSGDMQRLGLLRSVEESGVQVKTGVSLTEVPSGFDTVLYATGMRSNDQLYFDIANLAARVILVGDAKRAGKVDGAIHDGYFAARDLG
jgi:pyruvate/2-oxoglutarate dehydrogenase complex dihydrolipoamide dehydrogenase (E3) component